MMAPRMGVTGWASVSHWVHDNVRMLSPQRAELTIAPELEEGGQAGGTLVAHAERTTSLTSVQRLLDVVLEDSRCAVVREALAQLDNGDEEGGFGERVTDAAQRALFLFRGHLAAKLILLVGRGDCSGGRRGRRVGHVVLFVYCCVDDGVGRGAQGGARQVCLFVHAAGLVQLLVQSVAISLDGLMVQVAGHTYWSASVSTRVVMGTDSDVYKSAGRRRGSRQARWEPQESRAGKLCIN
jgi:hypothetical protein